MYDGQGPYGSSYIDASAWQKSSHDRSVSTDKRPPMPSLRQPPNHQRALTEDNSRPPPVKLRSRSNTSASALEVNATRKGYSMDGPADGHRARPSVDRPKSSNNKADRSDGFRRGLKAKSSRLFKRPESCDELTSLTPPDLADELDDICPKLPEEEPVPEIPKQPRKGSKGNAAVHRYNISEPFNFQHLTHTEPSQFEQIRDAGHDDIISEFSAMRASQAPRRQLQGIKTQELQWREPTLPFGPHSPVRSNSADATPTVHRQTLQHGLCRPASTSHVPRFSYPTMLATPEPKGSGNGGNAVEPFPPMESPTNRPVRSEHHHDEDLTFDQQPVDYPVDTWFDGEYQFELPHAVTTQDDVAQPLQPPSFPLTGRELSQVLEEDEYRESRRYSSAASLHQKKQSMSELRSSRSSPNIKRLNPLKTGSFMKVPLYNGLEGDVRGPSVVEQSDDIPYRPFSIDPPQIAGGGPEASWEDDIDWCYDNEAEADCNFDWHRSSALKKLTSTLHKAGSVRVPSNGLEHLANKSQLRQPTRIPYRTSSIYSSAPSLIVPSRSLVPDLDPPSAISTQSSLDSISEAPTPVESSSFDLSHHILTATCKPACQDWVDHRASALPVDPDSTLIYEDSFHVIYARKSLPVSTSNFVRTEGSIASSVSPRSSQSPISKSSSLESFWSGRDNRSDSGGSLPDLIHSKPSVEKPALISARSADDRGFEPSTTVTDAGQAIQRRRSPSLAKDVAYKSMWSKIERFDDNDSDDELPLPPRISSLDRPNSDSGVREFNAWALPPPQRPQGARSRSGSATKSFKSASTTVFNPFPIDPLGQRF